jgi:hypothetical protein
MGIAGGKRVRATYSTKTKSPFPSFLGGFGIGVYEDLDSDEDWMDVLILNLVGRVFLDF